MSFSWRHLVVQGKTAYVNTGDHLAALSRTQYLDLARLRNKANAEKRQLKKQKRPTGEVDQRLDEIDRAMTACWIWRRPVDLSMLRHSAYLCYAQDTLVVTGSFNLDRAGGGCGALSASARYLFGRGGNPRMYPFGDGGASSTALTTVTRPGCWINMVPAGGLLLIPEGSSGCECAFPVQTSIAFTSRRLGNFAPATGPSAAAAATP